MALSSVFYAALIMRAPTAGRLQIAYVLVSGTLISGTILTVMHPARLVQSCLTGLVYLGIVFAFIVAARERFVEVSAESSK